MDISSLLKPHTRWLVPTMVAVGDIIDIIGEGYIDDTYGRDQLVLSVRHNGVQRQLRLSPSNLRRIAAAYGPETSAWVGKKLRVAAIRCYEALRREGLILEPLPNSEEPSEEELLLEMKRVSWKPSRFGNGEIAPVSQLPRLTDRLRREGVLRLGNWDLALTRNHRWVFRRRRTKQHDG